MAVLVIAAFSVQKNPAKHLRFCVLPFAPNQAAFQSDYARGDDVRVGTIRRRLAAAGGDVRLGRRHQDDDDIVRIRIRLGKSRGRFRPAHPPDPHAPPRPDGAG